MDKIEWNIKANPDADYFKHISKRVKENDGYCPCALLKNDDTKCMCKEFREQGHSGFCHCGRFYKVARAPIITLCGSTRFKDKFLQVQKDLTLQGYMVLSVGVFGHSGDNEALSSETKKQLDELHRSKIEISDAIYVINVGGYIGESTSKEIEWAKMLGKKIYYLEVNE